MDIQNTEQPWLNAYDPMNRLRARLIDTIRGRFPESPYEQIASMVDEFLEHNRELVKSIR